MKRLSSGFTLIELLIVIAVLGILAVAVLSAINPIEQINRSRDTGSRSDAEQLLGAIDRFYASKGYYPWLTDACTGPACEALGWTEVNDSWLDDGNDDVLGKLSEGGTSELKKSFTTRISGADVPLYVYNQGSTGNATYVCFESRSGSFTSEAWDRCIDTDGSGLPDDLQTVAGTICIGKEEKNYSCLP